MAVDVGRGQLNRIATEQTRAASSLDRHERSAALLLFYAVECAMKSRIMQEKALNSTSQLPPSLRSHNLRAMAKELRLGAADEAILGTYKSRGSVYPAFELHQVWRYGGALDTAEQARAMRVLRDLLKGFDVK